MQVKPFILLKGLASFIPGTTQYFCSSSGGSVSARYCYSVWMRHLIKAYEIGFDTHVHKIAELGPGDSLGIGLCAILCGVEEYYAFDAKPHINSERNKMILSELVMMLRRREPIPVEFTSISPALKEHSFPHHILTDEILNHSLHPDRINAINMALDDSRSENGIRIAYFAPWQDTTMFKPNGKLDMVFSQAVMEHVEQVDVTYNTLYQWLRPGGLMSHTIDYRAHGYARDWNGHWTISDFLWKMIKGKRPYLINRLAHSTHVETMKKSGFQIVKEMKRNFMPVARIKLAERFRTLTEDDLMTSGAFILALKPC